MQLFSIEVVGLEIKRDYYLNKLITKKHNGLIKVITGMRRCGKSYLLFTLFKQHLRSSGVATDHIIEIAFDSFESKILELTNSLGEFPEAASLYLIGDSEIISLLKISALRCKNFQ